MLDCVCVCVHVRLYGVCVGDVSGCIEEGLSR